MLIWVGNVQNESSLLCGFTTAFLHCAFLCTISWTFLEGKCFAFKLSLSISLCYTQLAVVIWIDLYKKKKEGKNSWFHTLACFSCSVRMFAAFLPFALFRMTNVKLNICFISYLIECRLCVLLHHFRSHTNLK